MRNPNTILDILNKRSIEDKEIDHLYKCLYNPKFYILAYNNLTGNNVDENSICDNHMKRINDIINEMKYERYSWHKYDSTVKTNCGFNDNLMLGEWRDRLVQEVLCILLTSIYEPKFSNSSTGFRNNMGCHTALNRIRIYGQACEWFIHGRIANMIDHNYLLEVLKKNINDGRFIELIRKMLKADKYGVDFSKLKSYSGSLLGGHISPLLFNIVLNEFDQYIESTINIKYNREKIRPRNKEYKRITSKIEAKRKKLKNDRAKLSTNEIKHIESELKDLYKVMRTMPTKVSIENCNYRRLSYTRYGHEWIICFTGTFEEAISIKELLNNFLNDNKIIQSEEIECISATNEKKPVKFLNYNLITQWDNSYIKDGKRRLIGTIAFLIPDCVANEWKKRYCKNNKPIHLSQRVIDSVFDIVYLYSTEYKGLCQYYKFARNQKKLNMLKWIIETSMAKTISAKMKISVNKVFKKYASTKIIDGFTYKTFSVKMITDNEKEVEAYFGAVPLKREIASKDNVINDIEVIPYCNKYASISTKITNTKCIICGSTKDIQQHHINHMKNIINNDTLSYWQKKCIALKRKTIPLCKNCHNKVHNGIYNDRKLS